MTRIQQSCECVANSTAEIDVKLVAARWRHLHAVWAGDLDEVDRTAATLDDLLEERHYVVFHECEVLEGA